MKYELLIAVALLLAFTVGSASAATVDPCAGLPQDQCAFVSSEELPAYAQAALEAQLGAELTSCGPILLLSSGDANDDDNDLSTALGNAGCGENPDGFATHDCVTLEDFTSAEDSVVMAFSSEWPEYLNSTFTDWMFVGSSTSTLDLSLDGWDTDKVHDLPSFGPDGAGAISLASIGAEQAIDLRVADSSDLVYDSALIVAPRACFGTNDVETQFCGNGNIDPGEDCDGNALGNATCSTLGYDGGVLSCNPQTCQFEVNACTTVPEDNGTDGNNSQNVTRGTVQIMKHICNDEVDNLQDFEALGSFVNKVLACPTTILLGDEFTDGVHAEHSQFDFEVRANGEVQTLEDANFIAQKLCETDISLDVNGDGNVTADVCLDTSLYAINGVVEGEVAVEEVLAPEGTVFGALEFTPVAVMANTDADALVSVDHDAGLISLDTELDTDSSLTLHIYNFQVDEEVPPPANNQSNQTACFTQLQNLPVTCQGGDIVMDITTSCRHVTCAGEDGSMQVMACAKPDNALEPEYFELYKQQGSGTGVEVCMGNECLVQGEGETTAYVVSEKFPICVEGVEATKDSCLQAIRDGDLRGQIYPDGTSVIWNDADESFEVGAAVYKQFERHDIEGQELYDSATGVVSANGNLTFQLDAPVCAWQYEVFCGDEVIEDLSQEFYGDRKIYFEYSQGLPFCAEDEEACTTSVILTGDNEVPPVDSEALGTASVKLSNDELVVQGGVVFLQSPLMAIAGSPGHVHFGDEGVNGPVVWNLEFTPEEEADAATFALVQEISSEERDALVDGEYYLNIHSELYPAGTVRGQIEFSDACVFDGEEPEEPSENGNQTNGNQTGGNQSQVNVTFDVTIENLVEGQPLSPFLAVTHKDSLSLYETGAAASGELEAIAQDGDNSALEALLSGNTAVTYVYNVGAPLTPAGSSVGNFTDSVSFQIHADEGDVFSLASMLICTNDGFTGLNSESLPFGGGETIFSLLAYDAGTEANSELSEDMVDPCSGLGPIALSGDPNGNSNSNQTNSTIGLHPGIVGEFDLNASLHGWEGPVARVVVSLA